MRDDLWDRFDEFRAASIAGTRPPGVDAVRRRVARRRSARAAGLAAAAMAVLVLAWLPGGDGHGPAPINPPSASPTPSAPASPSPSPTPSHSPSASQSPILHPPTCPGAERFLTHVDPDTYSISTELINACPTVALRLVRVTYVGLGAAPAKLTRYATETHSVTPSSRTATFHAATRPTGTCYAYVTATLISPSGRTPSSIPDVRSGADPLGTIRAWFTQHGYPLLDTDWGDPAC